MFGVHGTHFGYKVLFAQAGTIILQSTSRLSLLGAAPLIQDGGYFNGIYWDAKVGATTRGAPASFPYRP